MIPPTIDTVEDVVITALNIDRVSTTIVGAVAQNIGEARLVTSDVIKEFFLLHPLNRQLDGPVIPLRILKQIFFPVKVPIEFLASSVLLSKNNNINYNGNFKNSLFCLIKKMFEAKQLINP